MNIQSWWTIFFRYGNLKVSSILFFWKIGLFFSIKKFHRSLITKYKIIFNQNKILFYLLINILVILIVTYLYRIRIKPFGKTYPTCIFQLANL